MNIYGAMNTAKWALLANQTAIEVTGQNVANVNNQDYTVQQVVMQAQYPVNQGNYMMGTGVAIAGVTRRFDQFLYNQRLENNYNLNKAQARSTLLDRLDVTMNEATGNGISNQMSNFFQGFYNLANNPSGATERRDVTEKAKGLAQKISYVASDLQRMRKDTDLKIAGAVPSINQLTKQIADINKVIHETETGGAQANDYRDKRESLIKQVSNLVDVSYFEQSNGEVTVMMKNGRPLVTGQDQFLLSAATNPSDPSTSSVYWADSAGNKVNITSEITGGQIGAWMTMRDTDINKALNDLDTLAGSIIKEVNRLHNKGFGMDGSTGNDFFNGLTPGGRASALNKGTGVVNNGTVLNPDNVNTDHYRVSFNANGTYNVTNTDKGSASGTYAFTSGAPLSFFQQRGFSISITGAPQAGDSFDLSSIYNSASSMTVNPAITNDLNKVSAASTKAWGDGSIAQKIAGLQFQKTLGGVWSQNAPVASATYTSTSGIYTFNDFYGAVVGGVGANARAATDDKKLQDAVSTQLTNLRDQVSGVALDEEMVNLVKYQHGYQASAKMISAVDDMLNTLLGIK